MSYQSYYHACNNTLARMGNVRENVRVSNAFSHWTNAHFVKIQVELKFFWPVYFSSLLIM